MTGVSWHAGCPVSLDDLRLLTVAYIGFDGVDHSGQLVVHKNVASAVLDVFAQMRAAGFRIERMDLIDVYGGSDDASTKANNTSAFNCRAVTGGSGWSRHAYGRAIDINPVQNPYVYADGHVLDPNAARYTNRALDEPGMIHDGDVVTKAFAAIGWRWGGHFNPPIDYQHFDTA
jgi:D-alanyl-D-alanine carboxypeptidase-like protein